MGARILIIEDNPANMALMAQLLTACGHTPVCAVDGASGVRMACAAPPDLILCGLHLPEIDGGGVLAALKADAGVAAIPVLAVTALATVGERARSLAAGFDGCLAQPVEPEQFVSELALFLAAPTPRSARHGKLLIVDDDAFMRELLCDILEPEGYAIVSVASATDAIGALADGSVSVIVCDQCMPLMTGTAFFERARQLAPSCYRIMLTAVEAGDGADKALRLAEQRGDIDRRLAKPFDGAGLRAAVAEGFRVAARRAARAFYKEPTWPKN